MSITEIIKLIKEYCDNGSLFPMEPQIPSDPILRSLYVSAGINQMLIGPWENQKQEEEWGAARAIMDSFVSGRIISVPKPGTNNKSRHQMAQLEPEQDGIWEIRTTKPKPGIRLAGLFVKQDLFVVLTWDERRLLDNFGSKQWRILVLGCQTEWKNLFFTYLPFKGDSAHDYITNIFLN